MVGVGLMESFLNWDLNAKIFAVIVICVELMVPFLSWNLNVDIFRVIVFGVVCDVAILELIFECSSFFSESVWLVLGWRCHS